MQSSPGARLDQFRLVASAIAGQTIEVTLADPGKRSWCDGSTVFLEPGASPAEWIRMLAVQASLVCSGSLEPAILAQLVHRPALARRYLAVEGHRSLQANEHVLPPYISSLIDADRVGSVATAADSLRVARGRLGIGEPPSVFGIIDARRTLAAGRDAAPLGQPGRAEGDLAELEEEEDGEESGGDLLVSPVGGGGAVGRLLQKMFRPTRQRGGGGPPPSADAPTHRTSIHSGGNTDVVVPAASIGVVEAMPTIDPASAGTAYPEWDVTRGRYRPAWCTVVEEDARVDKVATMEMPNVLGLRRSLARLGMGLTRCRRQVQGDDIDLDAAVEAHVDHLAGMSHGDDGYLQTRRRRRDLSILILLDVSGSASERGVAGMPVHEHQRAAAISLATALNDLGDRVALYGFNSRGRKAVQLFRVKGFDDRLDVQATRRLASLEPAAYTRLGAAIRHGTTILEQRSGTPRRLLVVLSDGFAYDHGYENRYGEADARRSLTEARRRGIGCVCLSIGTGAEPAALRRVFGSAAHAMVPSSGLLPSVIAPLFRSALRSAERQQRTFERQARTRERRQFAEKMQ